MGRPRRGDIMTPTHWFLLIALGCALIVEVWAYFDQRVPLITRVVRALPAWVTFLCGFLAGHLWWGG
jgi:hypothetical protein